MYKDLNLYVSQSDFNASIGQYRNSVCIVYLRVVFLNMPLHQTETTFKRSPNFLESTVRK